MDYLSFPQIGDVEVVEVYEYYDQPVLFACRDRTELLYLAVLSEDAPDHETWLLTAMSPKRFAQVRTGEVDLYSAFVNAERAQVYRATLPRAPADLPAAEWVAVERLTRGELPLTGESVTLLRERVARLEGGPSK